MIYRKKQYIKPNNMKVNVMLIVILLTPFLSSLLLKMNIMIVTEALLLGILFIWYIYINEKRLLVFTILSILFTPTFGIINGGANNIPYFIIALLSIKLFEKRIVLKEKILFNKIIVFLTVILFIINIFSLIYNQYSVGIFLIVFYSLKKFSFLILYLFFINANITKKDIKNCLNIIIIFGLFQFIVVVMQFATGVRQDALGGMFGESATGIMIQFLTIILILTTVYKDKLYKAPFLDLIVMVLTLIYSAMGEVKIGFLIIPFVYFFTLFLKKEKTKIIVTLCVLFFCFTGIYTSFINLYPDQDLLSSLTSSQDYLQNAYGFDQVNRTGYLSLLKSTVLETIEKQLFGNGLAALNPSKTPNLQGPLIARYGYLNTHFFAFPYSVAESGIIGTVIWVMIYVYILIANIKKYVYNKNENSIVNIALIIDNFIFMIYNNSLFNSFTVVLILWFVISYFNTEKIILD